MAKPKQTPTTSEPAAPGEPKGPATVEEVLAANTPDPLEEAKREALALGTGDEPAAPPPPVEPAPPPANHGVDDGAPPPVAEPPKPMPRWLVVRECKVNLGNSLVILRAGKILSAEWADRIPAILEHGAELLELDPE
jgi:hypothetical protein